MICDQVLDSGAYVLGILEADERAAYERHLATCSTCQREVADFSGLPDLLAQLDPQQAAAIGDESFDDRADDRGYDDRDFDDRGYDDRGYERPLERRRPAGRSRPLSSAPPRPLPSAPRGRSAEDSRPRGSRVERGSQLRRRRWQTLTAGLAAFAFLALGVLIGTRYLNNGPTPTPVPKQMVAMDKVASSVPITAQVALNPFIGGTEVRMHCVYDGGVPAPRWTLKLYVYPKDGGAPEQVSTWTAAHGDDLTLSAATRLTPAEIAKVELRKGDNTSLLVYQNA